MPYREKKIFSGKILEVEVFPITIQERKQSRRKKEKESLPKQKNLNNKNAVKHVVRLVNRNFTEFDIVLHLTYRDKELPKSEENARRDIVNYLRRIKNYRKKNGLPELKYIYVIEYRDQEEGKKIRLHHHVIMSGMDRDIAEKFWKKGRANADRLQSDEYGFEALGKYITKDPKGSKRWSQSKNLKQPVVKVNDYKYTRKKIDEIFRNPEDRSIFEKLYPGYVLNECKANVNDIWGFKTLNIKFRKLE